MYQAELYFNSILGTELLTITDQNSHLRFIDSAKVFTKVCISFGVNLFADPFIKAYFIGYPFIAVSCSIARTEVCIKWQIGNRKILTIYPRFFFFEVEMCRKIYIVFAITLLLSKCCRNYSHKYSQSCFLLNYISVISSIFINKFV